MQNNFARSLRPVVALIDLIKSAVGQEVPLFERDLVEQTRFEPLPGVVKLMIAAHPARRGRIRNVVAVVDLDELGIDIRFWDDAGRHELQLDGELTDRFVSAYLARELCIDMADWSRVRKLAQLRSLGRVLSLPKAAV